MKKFILLFILLLCACSTSSVEYRTATTALRNDNDYNKAEEFAKKALEIVPEDALPAYFLAMEVYGAKNSPKKDYQKSAFYFQEALRIDQIDGENQKLEESRIVETDEGYKELITIKEAIDYYSLSIWSELFNEAFNSKNKGNIEVAIEMFLVCTDLRPERIENYEILSGIFYDKNNFEKAIEYAEKGLKINPDYSFLWTVQGMIAMTNNDNIQAEEMLRKAFNLASQANESSENLSGHMSRLFDILFKNGKKEEALQLSEELIANNPEDVLLYSNAGVVYQNLLEDSIIAANQVLSQISQLNELELESLKTNFEDCINLATKARENFLMCSELELDEIESQKYYAESKKLKIQINEIKRQIKSINKAIDELE